jgi:ribosomal protein S18 acetylase RimI-like enzyme
MLNERCDVSVRRARPEEAAALAAVYRDSWRQAYTGILPSDHLENEIRRRDVHWWQQAISAESNLLVVLHSGDVAGYAMCGRARGGKRHWGEIYELYISPIYQGAGLGEHLFEACRATLDGLRLQYLIVWALAQNEAARRFYLRCGGRPSRRVSVRLGRTLSVKVAFEW